jgi:hypothetical protein
MSEKSQTRGLGLLCVGAAKGIVGRITSAEVAVKKSVL